jgi:hypothetical protein
MAKLKVPILLSQKFRDKRLKQISRDNGIMAKMME